MSDNESEDTPHERPDRGPEREGSRPAGRGGRGTGGSSPRSGGAGNKKYGERQRPEWKPGRDREHRNRQGDTRGDRSAPAGWGDRGKAGKPGARGGSGAQRPRGDWKDSRDAGAGQRGRGGTRGGGRSDRGGAGRTYTEAERLEHSLRPVREKHIDPVIPEQIEAKDLHPGARNELKTLDKELAEIVARHLAAVSLLIDEDPERAHQHAISAMRKAGRIPVTRETYAITSYVTGDYATALRELRTYRRLTGSELQLALMIDCERGLGRPEKAVEVGRAVDVSSLPTDVQVQVAIAMSGARLDLGQTQQALYELEIPQLDPERAFSWSPELFAAYATVLEELGRDGEAKQWRSRAFAAEDALARHHGGDVVEIIDVEEEPGTEPESASTSEPTSTPSDHDVDGLSSDDGEVEA